MRLNLRLGLFTLRLDGTWATLFKKEGGASKSGMVDRCIRGNIAIERSFLALLSQMTRFQKTIEQKS